jgi:hypothetical protein
MYEKIYSLLNKKLLFLYYNKKLNNNLAQIIKIDFVE